MITHTGLEGVAVESSRDPPGPPHNLFVSRAQHQRVVPNSGVGAAVFYGKLRPGGGVCARVRVYLKTHALARVNPGQWASQHNYTYAHTHTRLCTQHTIWQIQTYAHRHTQTHRTAILTWGRAHYTGGREHWTICGVHRSERDSGLFG